MAEITHLPGLDERGWKKYVPIWRQALAAWGLGDASADEILADFKPRVMRAAPFSTERAPEEYIRIVSKAYFDLMGEMLALVTELHLARRDPGPANSNDKT